MTHQVNITQSENKGYVMSPKQHFTKKISGGETPDCKENLCETNEEGIVWKVKF